MNIPRRQPQMPAGHVASGFSQSVPPDRRRQGGAPHPEPVVRQVKGHEAPPCYRDFGLPPSSNRRNLNSQRHTRGEDDGPIPPAFVETPGAG